MKVLLINGSPKEHGCTYTALAEAAKTFEECQVESEIFWVGNKSVPSCLGCGGCAKTGRCIVADDVNRCADILRDCDGLIVGSPVHYASPSGEIISFMDRLFYSARDSLAHKPAACIVSARRAGTTASIEVLNKYFSINQMPIVSSTYWPMVHGSKPEEVLQDAEGMQVVRMLARNMAWLIKCIEVSGIAPPEWETPHAFTNFIR